MGSLDPGFEALVKEARSSKWSSMRTAAELEIPLKVHVLLDTPQIVSDEQVFSQMNVLNKDYEEYFTFTLKDVTRTTTSKKFSSNSLDEIMDIIPEDLEVLNIWVVDFQSTQFLGAASFPWSEAVGGLDSASILQATFPPGKQGLAMSYKAFGTGEEYDLEERFDQGKTVTHEAGHFLGLHHPWGLLESCENDDFCDDTPAQAELFFRCPEPTDSSCPPFASLDLSNYMQFVDDACMDHFTTCQLERMTIVAQMNMTHLLNSPALDLPDYQIVTGFPELEPPKLMIYPNPSTDGRFFIEPANLPMSIYDLSGKVLFEGVSGEIGLNRKGLFLLKLPHKNRVQIYRIWSI